MNMRLLRVFMLVFFAMAAATPSGFATFCVPGKKPAEPPPPDPNPPVCEPKKCDRCSKSPCYLVTGTYVNEFTDLQIPTAGTYPLTVSRRYESSRPTDGPLGAGWSSSLTAHLYYATYLVAAPSTYSYEADVVMPDGVLYTFSVNSGGTFTAPFGRYETLVLNGDGTYTLTLYRGRGVFRFNADGSIASLTDEYGNQITYTYDGSGRLQRIADTAGSGRYIDVTWGADGRIASLTDNSGRVLKYFYETGNGTLTSYSDPLVSSDNSKRTTYYSYISGRFGPVLSRIEDRWHRTITDIEWYANGKLKSYTDGAFNPGSPSTSEGERYTYAYISAPPPYAGGVTKTDSFGTRTYYYDTVGLVSDANATYSGGQTEKQTIGAGHNSFTYDAAGRILTVTQSPTGQAAGNVVWTYTYDTTFPNKVASIIPKDIYGNLRTDWAGWIFSYNSTGGNAPGALAYVYRVRNDKTTKDLIASYTYDARGRVLSANVDNSLTAAYIYNGAGDLTSAYENGVGVTMGYDTLGRPTSKTEANGQVTTYVYDVLDRVTSITLPKPTAGSTLNFVTTYSYDNYDATTGLVFIHRTDPNGRVTKAGFDAMGHVARTVDEAGAITQFTFRNALLKKITDANGNETTFTYNANRELSATTSPEGGTETYNLSNGVFLGKTDRRGQSVSYTYDGVGRITRISYPGVNDPFGSAVGPEFSYEGQNLAYIFDHTTAGMQTYQYTYDTAWRPTVENIWNSEKTTYTYMPGPWATSQIKSFKIEPSTGTPWNPQTVTYGYDSGGRVNSISWNWIPSGSFSISYAPTGEFSRITFPNGQTRNYTYDNQVRLTNVSNNDATGGVLASFDYSYDYDWAAGTATLLGQRTGVYVTAVPGTALEIGQTKYRYDSRYQLVRVDHPNGQYETWTYDAIGNRTSENGITYDYYKNAQDLNSQRMRTYHSGFPDMLYDANGNLTGWTNLPNTYVWDWAGRLSATSGTTYAYDFLGRRRSATTGSSTTKYISHDLHTVAERNTTAGVATDYLFGPGIDQPLAKIVASGAVSYYGVDGLGSVVLVTNTSGQVIGSTSYGAWGGGGGSELFGFTGREGAFFRARQYAGGWGRFLNEDPKPWADPLRNHYRYAGNNPALYVDPFGEDYKPVSPVWNFDRTPRTGYGDTGPPVLGLGKPDQVLRIPPGPPKWIPPIPIPFDIPFWPFPTTPPIPVPSTAPWQDVDFVCTRDGWKKTPLGGVIVNGRIYGLMIQDPPPDWKPPFPCPPDKCVVGSW